MKVLDLLLYPLRRWREVTGERMALVKKEAMHVADFHAGIENGTIRGSALDAVSECLDAISLKPPAKVRK